jgi:hypothetical protein
MKTTLLNIAECIRRENEECARAARNLKQGIRDHKAKTLRSRRRFQRLMRSIEAQKENPI